MTEEALAEKRIYDQKQFNLQQELYSMIPGWSRILSSGFFDIVLCASIPIYIYIRFIPNKDFDLMDGIIIFFMFLISFGLNFYFSTRKQGSTIGMYLFGIMLANENTFYEATGEDIFDMLFLRVETDIIYTDLYETASFIGSSKKQTIAMKRMKMVYVKRRAYKKFKAKYQDDIKELIEYRYKTYRL
jgi:uncharacterized RDD family membrane protein YckC